MASRWPIPPARERGDVLLSSGPGAFYRWLYGGMRAFFAVLIAVALVMTNLFPHDSPGTERAVQAVVFGGLILFLMFGFLLFTTQGVWATREGILLRNLPGTGKFLPWSEINSLEPGQRIGTRLRTLIAHTSDGKSLKIPVYDKWGTSRVRFRAKLTPEGARLVGPDNNPAVVLPQLLELHRQNRLNDSL
ncbi:hypothetical protein M3D53_01475 [Dermabacter hominis]|uniref:hypothetical protein n=1 Tax=Dermabacter hominis TaxID=36740 RepID=UPI0021A849C0|nr:hypothetical protein [Dermabacter hominis]MCT2056291.1 hypothetical protein [Dermabacter hominis]MCT2083157.1 hypothetical protein [Dermabacter hominis]MCT2091939.1 hypothetical protein [Dermabacter hominis]MCT2190142.1 hypothetical protein [Dermabacter hominis]MCT2226350.1 hypothetical protein [Dermabacter hominis]